jgi:hypothetical protein
LTNLQKSQQSRAQELHCVLQSLSPSRNIHGVTDIREGEGFSDPTGPPGEFDPDSSINFEDDSDYSQIERSSCKSATRPLANSVCQDDNLIPQHGEAMEESDGGKRQN